MTLTLLSLRGGVCFVFLYIGRLVTTVEVTLCDFQSHVTKYNISPSWLPEVLALGAQPPCPEEAQKPVEIGR